MLGWVGQLSSGPLIDGSSSSTPSLAGCLVAPVYGGVSSPRRCVSIREYHGADGLQVSLFLAPLLLGAFWPSATGAKAGRWAADDCSKGSVDA